MVTALENIFWMTKNIFSAFQKMVGEAEKMVGTTQKMVEIGRRYKSLYFNGLIIV
jgi:hypothetical protein